MNNKKPNLTQAIIRGAFWVYAARYSSKFIAFIATIILARLLLQEDFGLASFAFLVTNYLEVMTGLGIGSALIYYDRGAGRTSSGFWTGLGMSLFLLALTWLSAPLIANLFNEPRAAPVIQVMTIMFPLIALNIVPQAILRKNLAFKRKFIPDFAEAVGKNTISVILALMGFGVWSLVFGQITGAVLTVIAYWSIVSWRPSFQFNFQLARSLVSYGSNIVSLRMLRVISANIDYLFVGRFLGTASLGVYTLAFRMPDFLILQFTTVISEVLFPAYTKMRDDPAKLSRGFLTTVSYVSMISVPLGLGLAMVSKPFVLTVFTEKWVEAIPVIPAIAISALITTLSFNSGEIYKAQGRPGILTKIKFVRIVIFTPMLWWAVAVPGTIAAVGWAQAAASLIITMIHFTVIRQVLHIPFRMIFETLRPSLIGGAVMTLMVWGTLLILADALPVVQLVVSVTIGALTYGSVVWWLQREAVIKVSHTLRAALVRR